MSAVLESRRCARKNKLKGLPFREHGHMTEGGNTASKSDFR